MWDKKRRREMSDLLDLLGDLNSLNKGSHFIENVTKCVEAAEKLTKLDLSSGRPNFTAFLIEESVKD